MKKQPNEDENFDQGHSPKQGIDPKFERVLKEYMIVLRAFRQRCIETYGAKAERWFNV